MSEHAKWLAFIYQECNLKDHGSENNMDNIQEAKHG